MVKLLRSLFPLALGVGLVYAFVWLRDRRDFEVANETKPAEPGALASAPAASAAGTDETAYVAQHPGMLDEFSPEAVQVTGDLVTGDALIQPTNYTPSDDAATDYDYRDEASGASAGAFSDRPVRQTPRWATPVIRDGGQGSTLTPSHAIGAGAAATGTGIAGGSIRTWAKRIRETTGALR